MRKLTLVSIVALVVLSASVASAASITTTKHNFSTATPAYDTQICRPCHTPHNGQSAITFAPLWNHADTAVTNFTMYTSGTFNATAPAQPAGLSRACLSCHDGTVAVDAYGGAAGNPATKIAAGNKANFGTDLSNDHPISFDYQSSITNGDLELHPTTDPGIGGTIAATLLFTGKMECASCHDVHGTPGIAALLRMDNAGSALCLKCHNK